MLGRCCWAAKDSPHRGIFGGISSRHPRSESSSQKIAGSNGSFLPCPGKLNSCRYPIIESGEIMTDKTASVHWEGRGKQGAGKISTQTDALKSYPYGYRSRFEDDRRGTNPEELLAAAHAACFTMAFSFACDA